MDRTGSQPLCVPPLGAWPGTVRGHRWTQGEALTVEHGLEGYILLLSTSWKQSLDGLAPAISLAQATYLH